MQKNTSLSLVLRLSLLILVSVGVSGCFRTVLFMREHILVGSVKNKSVNILEYHYLGSAGPDAIWVENEYAVRARLPFETSRFPNAQDIDNLNLDDDEAEALRKRAISTLRDYFGDQKKIQLVTLKRIRPKEVQRYLLDARLLDYEKSAVEILAEQGLSILDKDLLKSSGMRYLFKVQKNAQRSRRGIWKHVTSLNPNWHD